MVKVRAVIVGIWFNQRGRAEMRDQGDRQVLVEIRFDGKCAARDKVGQWVMD